jgi:hypothetical protein
VSSRAPAPTGQATNTFLNWFKLINYLSYAPQFAVLTDTLSRAMPEIMGFGLVFAMVFYGFAQVVRRGGAAGSRRR